MTSEHRKITQPTLAGELKREAGQQAPPFSANLHERIMRAVRQAPPSPAAHPPAQNRWLLQWSWRSWAAAGVAAAAVLLLAHWQWQLRTTPAPLVHNAPKTQQMAMAVPSLPAPTVEKFMQRAGETAASQVGESGLAYLDQDAMRFAQFLRERLSVPSLGQ